MYIYTCIHTYIYTYVFWSASLIHTRHQKAQKPSFKIDMTPPPPVIRNPVIRNPVSQISDSFYFLAEEIEILQWQQTYTGPRSVKCMQNPFEKYRCLPKIASPEVREKCNANSFEKYRCVTKTASRKARKTRCENPLRCIVVYLKSPRRRREQN